jgi:hypothetical protein
LESLRAFPQPLRLVLPLDACNHNEVRLEFLFTSTIRYAGACPSNFLALFPLFLLFLIFLSLLFLSFFLFSSVALWLIFFFLVFL